MRAARQKEAEGLGSLPPLVQNPKDESKTLHYITERTKEMKDFMNANTIEELKEYGKLVEVRAMFKTETEALEGTFKTRSWADMLESIQTARELLKTEAPAEAEETLETLETAPAEITETEAPAEEPEAEEATETEETAQADETVNPIIPVIEYEIPGSVPNFIFVSRTAEQDPEPEAEKPAKTEAFKKAAGMAGNFAKAALPVLGKAVIALAGLAGSGLISIGKLLFLLLLQADDLLHCVKVYGPDAGRAVLRWLDSTAVPAVMHAGRAAAGFAVSAACTVATTADFLRLLLWNTAASAADSAKAGWSFREELIQEAKAA